MAKPIYCGTSSWGDRSGGKYSPIDETIIKEGVVEAIVSPELFAKVRAKLGTISGRRYQRRQEYPLRGLIFCGHCGEPMQGAFNRYKKRDGKRSYQYHQYLCAQYRWGPHLRTANCGHFAVDADRVLRWLVRALQEVFLGPGRDTLVQEIERQLRVTVKTTDSNAGRLQKRLKDLDKQIDRLRRAIAQIDDTGLVEQLRQSKAERERIAAELAQAGQFSTPRDIHREAQRIADRTWELGERLGDADPATLRELLQRTVSRITCRWDTTTTKSGRTRCPLAEGRVELRDHPLFCCLSRGVAHAEAWER